LPLDHTFGFELADVGPAAIKVQRQCRRADGIAGLPDRRREEGLATGGRSTLAAVAAIVFIPVASAGIAQSRSRRQREHSALFAGFAKDTTIGRHRLQTKNTIIRTT